MARNLTFVASGNELVVDIDKVDRAKLYGHVETRNFDRQGNVCYLGSISGDGLHIFGRESFEQGYLSPAGEWVERSELQVVDGDGRALSEQEASFKRPLELSRQVTIDEYLLYCAKSVYQLTGDGLAALLALVEQAEGVYTFDFNYTKSYTPDPAFLIANDGALFMVVTMPTCFEFVGPDASEDLLSVDDEDTGDEDVDLDFGMI